jgi:hypothetical protein
MEERDLAGDAAEFLLLRFRRGAEGVLRTAVTSFMERLSLGLSR